MATSHMPQAFSNQETVANILCEMDYPLALDILVLMEEISWA